MSPSSSLASPGGVLSADGGKEEPTPRWVEGGSGGMRESVGGRTATGGPGNSNGLETTIDIKEVDLLVV